MVRKLFCERLLLTSKSFSMDFYNENYTNDSRNLQDADKEYSIKFHLIYQRFKYPSSILCTIKDRKKHIANQNKTTLIIRCIPILKLEKIMLLRVKNYYSTKLNP